MNTQRAESIRAMRPLFQVVEGGSIPTSALDLRFDKISLKQARPLNRLWHSRFPEVGGGGSRICYVAEFNGLAYATAIWTNPTAPALPQMEWLMLKRFAIAPDKPKNTASRMMGWMIRDILKRNEFDEVETLVSYSDPDSHEGTIYRATGWTRDTETRRTGVMWHSRGRKHTANATCERVVRWLKHVRVNNPFGTETDEADV